MGSLFTVLAVVLVGLGAQPAIAAAPAIGHLSFAGVTHTPEPATAGGTPLQITLQMSDQLQNSPGEVAQDQITVTYDFTDSSITGPQNVSGRVFNANPRSVDRPVNWTCPPSTSGIVTCTTTGIVVNPTFDTLELKFEARVPSTYQGSSTLHTRATVQVGPDPANADSAPDTITIIPATSLGTTATPQASLGQPISDTARVVGGSVSPTGSVSFELFAPRPSGSTVSFCDASLRIQGYSSVVTLNNGTATSDPYITQAVGVYHWLASYGGDAQHPSIAGVCEAPEEQTLVAQNTVALSTQATPQVNLGGGISDVATLSGGSNPTGTIKFTLFAPVPNGSTLAACDPSLVIAGYTSSVTLTNGKATSASFTPTTAGTYHWLASYSGDANNGAITGTCDTSIVTSIVGSVPTAPNVSAIPGDGSAIVSWTAPTSDTPITQYTVTLALNGNTTATKTIDGSVRSLTWTGLTNGATYHIGVTAHNTAGDGPAGTVDVTPQATQVGGGGDGGPPNVGATPELDSIVLFGTGGLSLLGYALTRRRARRRQ